MSNFSNIIFIFLFLFQGFAVFSQSNKVQLPISQYSFLEQEDSISAYLYYQKLQALNTNNSIKSVQKRGNFTYKFDSSYTYRLTDDLVLESKFEYVIDKDNNREISLISNYNNESTLWESKSYVVDSYNDVDLLIKTTYNLWDGSFSNWPDDSASAIRKYEYNSDNQLIIWQVQDVEDILNNRIGSKTKYTYDSLGLLERQSTFYNVQDSFVHTNEMIFRYNEDNLLQEIIDSRYIEDQGWRFSDSIALTYYENGLLHEEEEFYWSSMDGYRPFRKDEYLYHADGKIDEITHKRFYDFDIMDYVIFEKSYYRYHSTGSLRKISKYELPEFTPEIQIGAELYEIDETVTFDEIFVPKRYNRDYYENNMTVYKEEKEIDKWTEEVIFAYPITENFYSPIETSNTADPSDAAYHLSVLHPNPANEIIKVSIPDYQNDVQLDIFDPNGHIVFSNRVQTSEIISIDHLNAGVYVYSILADKLTYNGKLIIVN